MKRLFSAMLGLLILTLPLGAALAEAWENPFEATEPFAGWDVEADPDAFVQEYESDPFAAFLGEDDPSQYVYSFDDDDAALFAFAFGEDSSFMSSDESNGENTPEPALPPVTGSSGSLTATINGESLRLNFDPSPVFSSVSNGMVQAAFYTYGDVSGNLCEFYLNFPATVRSGDAVTPDTAMQKDQDCSVMLLISNANEDHYYIASQLQNEVFPETSSYTIQFDQVEAGAEATTYSGTVTARMVSYNVATGKVGDSVSIEGASFNFTLSNTPVDTDPGDIPDGDSGHDFNDFPPIEPFATPTLPPDYRKV